MAGYNQDEKPCYAFAVVQGDCEIDVLLDAPTVERKVLESLAINPVLEGSLLYLQFNSHGGAFEAQGNQGGPLSVVDLVDSFIDQDHLQMDAEDYLKSLVELEQHLRVAQRIVYQQARKLGALPDPFSEGYRPELSTGLQAFLTIWERRHGLLDAA